MNCQYDSALKRCLFALATLLVLIHFEAPTLAQDDDPSDQPAPVVAAESVASRQDDADAKDTLAEILQGHSLHGDAFNEGPRQRAYLMGGTGNVQFPVTTESKTVQKFINQGIGQLHGFWYLEAERSFRQAAAIDENCAMAFWGAAWAAGSADAEGTSRKRAQGFIAKAVERKKNVTDREKLYIDALDKYLKDQPKEKEKRAAEFLKDLESIVIAYPDDLEAKAFVAHRIWYNAREGIPVASYLSTQALLNEIFAVEPLHPAHHYQIHLWDQRHPENALTSAARGGVAAPSIAHMWHMPGHIYSRLKRYEDAIYQQEASARVDHAHMMRDQVMPDEINNFAHNNEWLIRNLSFVGRAYDAMDLAKNMVELPRHPKYNTLEKKNGSASYGRRRLLQVLREFELFDDAIAICPSHYLDTPDVPEDEQIKAIRLLGCSAAIVGQPESRRIADEQLQTMLAKKTDAKLELETQVGRLNVALDESKDKPPVATKIEVDEKKAKLQLKEKKEELSKIKSLIDQIEKAQLAIEGYSLVASQDYKTAHAKLEQATGEDVSWLGELQFLGGDFDKGLETVSKQVERRPQEVIPLARLTFLQFQNGDVEDAIETMEKLRNTSSCMDIDLPMFARLRKVADEMNLGQDWRKPYEPPTDLGYRPALDSLGPFRWSPPKAPSWTITDSSLKSAGSSEFRGQPHLIIFYLGHGCLHCAEQLQKFAPRVKDFEAAGIQMIAISSDDREGLQKSIEAFNEEMPIRLAADEKLEVFKQFRAHDDFEKQPLHGTFLVDGAGRIRWQDISYEPFMDDEFLLVEAKRLLAEQLPLKRAPAVDVSAK